MINSIDVSTTYLNDFLFIQVKLLSKVTCGGENEGLKVHRTKSISMVRGRVVYLPRHSAK